MNIPFSVFEALAQSITQAGLELKTTPRLSSHNYRCEVKQGFIYVYSRLLFVVYSLK